MEQLFFQGFFSCLASLSFGVLFNVRGKSLLFASLGGMLGWLVFVYLQYVISEDMVRYFFGSLAVSIYAQRMAKVQKAPTLVFLVVGFIPLVPGYSAYQSMASLLVSDLAAFSTSATYTFKVVMAIAVGFLLSAKVIYKKDATWPVKVKS